MGRNPPEREEVYAVIRIDHFHSPDTPIDNKITVKEIVRDRRTAEAEVARLNAVNSDKNYVQARLEALHQHVGVPVPDGLGTGLDSLSPIIEHFMDADGIFFVKWDGERTSNRYTAIAMHPKIEQFRFDDKTPVLVAARVILHLAGPVFGLPEAAS